MKTCGDCRYWTVGLYDVVGECEIDMETKTRDTEACVRFEQRDKTT